MSKQVSRWLLVGASLFVASAIWHGLIHPGVGATAADSMPRIAAQAAVWQVSHLLFAVAALVFSSAALLVVVDRARTSANGLAIGGWALLVLTGPISAALTTMEATVQADAAVAGDLDRFAMWLSLSRGSEMVLLLIPLALAGVIWGEQGEANAVLPAWASYVGVAGAALVLAAIAGASWLRIEALGPLFTAGALPMLWLVWFGLAAHRRGEFVRLGGWR